MIKAIFLDIDNTLLDFDAYVQETMRTGFEKFGLRTYEEWMFPVFCEINNKLWRQIEDATLTFEELMKIRWNRIFEVLNISFDGPVFETYFRECLFDSVIPVEGALEMLKYLDGKYILCAASNGPYEQQLHRLDISGMLPYFTHIFVSGKIGVSKPAKEFFDYCMKELNENREIKIQSSEVLMLGDSLSSDMQGGINSGMKTCFYDRKGNAETGDMKIDYIISDLEKVSDYL